MTEAERTLWERLRQLPSGMSHFRRQDVIGPYFADFACRARRIVIDMASDQRGSVKLFGRDEIRAKKLEVRGYRVLLFGHSDVLGNIDGVMQTIRASLDGEQSAPP